MYDYFKTLTTTYSAVSSDVYSAAGDPFGLLDTTKACILNKDSEWKKENSYFTNSLGTVAVSSIYQYNLREDVSVIYQAKNSNTKIVTPTYIYLGKDKAYGGFTLTEFEYNTVATDYATIKVTGHKHDKQLEYVGGGEPSFYHYTIFFRIAPVQVGFGAVDFLRVKTILSLQDYEISVLESSLKCSVEHTDKTDFSGAHLVGTSLKAKIEGKQTMMFQRRKLVFRDQTNLELPFIFANSFNSTDIDNYYTNEIIIKEKNDDFWIVEVSFFKYSDMTSEETT